MSAPSSSVTQFTEFSWIPTPHHRSILDLNEDVFICVLEEIFVQKCLTPLSSTCKAVREMAKYIIFKRCKVKFSATLSVKIFPPASLWRYIRHLLLIEEEPEEDTEESEHDQRMGDPTLCRYLVPDFLCLALPRMPLLMMLSISSPSSISHRLPWTSLKAIFGTRQLREIEVSFYLLCAAGVQAQELDGIRIAPLTSFAYWVNTLPGDPRWLCAERDALGILLTKLSSSLQKLKLPIEPVPLDTVQSSHWSQLRHLSLYGEASPRQTVPYVIILGNMPELRSLALRLTLRPDVSTPIIWPPNLKVACPWPNLDDFTISHPHPKDQLYGCLPSTLRRLFLCCPPYRYHYLWGQGGAISEQRQQGSLLTASQTLRLLRRCPTPDLIELAIEFHEDSKEFELFKFLPRAFPRLTSLTANVYRSVKEHADVPVENIARALTPLSHLRTLRMYLGFRPTSTLGLVSFIPVYHAGEPCEDPAEVRLEEARDRAAQTIANLMGPSLRTIFLFHPSQPMQWYWMEYRIVPAPCGRAVEEHRQVYEGYELQYARGVLLAAPEGSSA